MRIFAAHCNTCCNTRCNTRCNTLCNTRCTTHSNTHCNTYCNTLQHSAYCHSVRLRNPRESAKVYVWLQGSGLCAGVCERVWVCVYVRETECVCVRVCMCLCESAEFFVGLHGSGHQGLVTWGRDPKKCTGRDWGMGSSTI